jgi:hypothetical protein
MELKPSRYHVVSASRIGGAGPAQERFRTLKAGRGKGKQPDRRQRWSPNRRSRPRAKMARAIHTRSNPETITELAVTSD